MIQLSSIFLLELLTINFKCSVPVLSKLQGYSHSSNNLIVFVCTIARPSLFPSFIWKWFITGKVSHCTLIYFPKIFYIFSLEGKLKLTWDIIDGVKVQGLYQFSRRRFVNSENYFIVCVSWSDSILTLQSLIYLMVVTKTYVCSLFASTWRAVSMWSIWKGSEDIRTKSTFSEIPM